MEKLLELAAAKADQAEVFSMGGDANEVSFRDAKLFGAETEMLSGVSLRIIKDGRLGFAWTRNLVDRAGLVENALASLVGGVEAGFEFPATPPGDGLDAFDPAVASVGSSELVDEGTRVIAELEERTGALVNLGAWTRILETRILNSRGTDLTSVTSNVGIRFSISVPGTGAGFSRVHFSRSLEGFPAGKLEEATDLYVRGRETVAPEGGRMKVLFMPNSLMTLGFRLLSGTNAKSVVDGISPIADRIGERIVAEGFSMSDDPRAPALPHPRPFDDEGVPCDRFPIIENGVLRGFYADLDHAEKLGIDPTGHGYRTAMWGGDAVTLLPTPSVRNLSIAPGGNSLADLIGMIDRGIILERILGAHSGNIPAGDYSVGVAPALYVENGEIVGRMKDTMVSGNVYETLGNLVAVGDTPDHGFGGLQPPLLCDDVRVDCR